IVPLRCLLLRRGKCAYCVFVISFLYFAVDLLTALLFFCVWKSFPWPMAIAYWFFVSLLVAATFIDFEHFIIPDEITIGGMVAGVVACFAVPELMDTASRGRAVLISALSAALGYVLLWIVLEAGKKVFGKKRIKLDGPTPFTWTRKGDDADFAVGEEQGLWSEYFSRETDQLILHCDEAIVGERNLGAADLRFHYDRVNLRDEQIALDTLDRISGVVRELEIPREAMGRGDLKFLACIGAFLGWRAVLFSVFAGSLVGSLVGLFTLLVGKRVWSAKLPFGPYLGFGALIWLFFGSELVRWYVGLVRP